MGYPSPEWGLVCSWYQSSCATIGSFYSHSVSLEVTPMHLDLFCFWNRSNGHCLLLPSPAMPGVPQGWRLTLTTAVSTPCRGGLGTHKAESHPGLVCLLPLFAACHLFLSEILDWVLHEQIFGSLPHHFVALTPVWSHLASSPSSLLELFLLSTFLPIDQISPIASYMHVCVCPYFTFVANIAYHIPALLLYLFAHYKTAANTDLWLSRSWNWQWKSHCPSASQKPLALLGALDPWSTAEQFSACPDGFLESGILCLVSCAEQSLALGELLSLQGAPSFAALVRRAQSPSLYFTLRALQSKYSALAAAICPTCSVPALIALCPERSFRRALFLANRAGEIRKETFPLESSFITPQSQTLSSWQTAGRVRGRSTLCCLRLGLAPSERKPG